MKLFVNDKQVLGNWAISCVNEIVHHNIDGRMVTNILNTNYYTLTVEGELDRRFQRASFGVDNIILRDEVEIHTQSKV